MKAFRPYFLSDIAPIKVYSSPISGTFMVYWRPTNVEGSVPADWKAIHLNPIPSSNVMKPNLSSLVVYQYTDEFKSN